jgi:hypothetical protein
MRTPSLSILTQTLGNHKLDPYRYIMKTDLPPSSVVPAIFLELAPGVLGQTGVGVTILAQHHNMSLGT